MKNKIIITGATSDIGIAIAKNLLESGYAVILIARNRSKLELVAERLEIPKEYIYCFDNDDIKNLKVLYTSIVKENGKVDGLICCAGNHNFKPLKIIKDVDYDSAYRANTLPSLMFAKYFSSNRFSNPNGSIVFISSVASIIGESGLSAYSAAKGALNSAARSLAVELAPKGLRVNCVSPGWVETHHAQEVRQILGEDKVNDIEGLYPLGFGTPSDIAGICKMLVSEDSRWLTGQNIIVDGGRSLV
jgi:NAD(P)-dependent dehydrogenase (short-subunit alcohol dehydrogenase family)